jgi:hypothetical protein
MHSGGSSWAMIASDCQIASAAAYSVACGALLVGCTWAVDVAVLMHLVNIDDHSDTHVYAHTIPYRNPSEQFKATPR